MENKPATGTSRDTSVRYEVHRERSPRPPVVEEFYGLDRARIAALSYALDGPTEGGERFTGTVRIVQVLSGGGRAPAPSLIDEVDERLAWRVLNVPWPKARDLAVSIDDL